MEWIRIKDAAQYAGRVNQKTIYAAIRRGDLRVARIGVGRNVLTSREWVDAWLSGTGDADRQLSDRMVGTSRG
jgi:excisionase family DNA binding protein